MFTKSTSYLRSICLMGSLLVLFAIGTPISSHAHADENGKEASTDVSKIVKKVSPAVVKITSFDGWGQSIGFGSGFIVDSDGVIVTNYHVVERAERVEVITKAGKTHQVSGVIAYDKKRDFAILKIQASRLPVIDMGDANKLEVGQEVVAIGHPRGLEFSVSAGILSQRRTESEVTWLQHTASISPGSSGGPLVNTRSEVVGINTAYRTDGQQLNFAIPIDYIRSSINKNAEVKYTVAGLRLNQQEQRQEQQQEVSGWLRSNFVQHEDRGGAFNVLFPSQWRVGHQDGLESGWIDRAFLYDVFSSECKVCRC